ncbi:DUF1835 domain-containing protein [Gracilibacillus thailandensis]|uniref:DUF1835 domain-containing protein n=1 Tax=Gracilibacillus thailandensis TaxID=563735 RepID=A0A6N7QUP6_9BACI|nr:DUF1835 domain-containing protein [Gracilibacillus thailandensis]MRI65274.1 DUF1835 domain-containing protein [Gracilibacillus thailandensis]
MDELRRIVKDAEEEEAKAVLLNLFLRIQMAEEIEEISDRQLAQDVKKVLNDYVAYKRKQETESMKGNYRTVHIVFGDSIAGSLKMALEKMNRQDEENIIVFSDFFSIGPIWQLHKEEGRSFRYQWLQKNINWDEEYIEGYLEQFNQGVLAVRAIQEHIPIVIWTGENAHEQTALRYVLSLLSEKTNAIFIINTTINYQRFFTQNDQVVQLRHSGEVTHDQLAHIYLQTNSKKQLRQEERDQLVREWEELATTKNLLRLWKDKLIQSVGEAYYDNYILDTVKKIHDERNNSDFVKVAIVIGELIGHADQYISDLYFEYRVRHLIVNGFLDIEGIPKGMRFYSVKIR